MPVMSLIDHNRRLEKPSARIRAGVSGVIPLGVINRRREKRTPLAESKGMF
jgi:hypothetical protein